MRAVLLVATLLTATAVAVPAWAGGGTTYTWVGNTSTPSADNHSWSDGNNWNPVGVPGNGDSVVIQQPSDDDCVAHVDAVPTVSLVNFTVLEDPSRCGTSVTGGSITVSGLFQWDGGKLDSPTVLLSTSTGMISGGNQRVNNLAAPLDVNNTLTVSGLSDPGTLSIAAGVALTIEPGADLVSGGSNTINGASCCTNPPVVHNAGTISVNGGTLTIASAQLDQFGTLTATLGGRLVTTDAPIDTDSAGNYTGNGTWLIRDRAAATFHGTQTIGQHFTLNFGGLGSTFSSTLAGAATLAGNGTFAWTGGVIEAGLTIGHQLELLVDGAHDGGARRVLSGLDLSNGQPGVLRTFTNHATTIISHHATITTSWQARLVNAADGVIRFEPGTSLSAQGCCTAPDRLTNNGVVSVTAAAGSGVSLVGVAYRSTATTAVATGKSLTLSGGARSALTGGVISGGGRLVVATPTTMSGTVTVGLNTRVVLATHGSLDGNATLAGAGAFGWTGGAMSVRPVVRPAGGIAVSGGGLKTIATVGGGSTPSLAEFASPTTIAAGTVHAHDLVNLGSSRLVLSARTTTGTFTEFANGTLENRRTLTIRAGTVFGRNYVQTSTGALALDVASGRHGSFRSIGAVTLHGSLRVHNRIAPHLGASIVALEAQSITGSLTCVTTSGTSSGSGHWTASRTSTRVVLRWQRGAHTHC